MRKKISTILTTLLTGSILCSCNTAEGEAVVESLSPNTTEQLEETIVVETSSTLTPATTEAPINPAFKEQTREIIPMEFESSKGGWHQVESIGFDEMAYFFFRLDEKYYPDSQGDIFISTYDEDSDIYQIYRYNVANDLVKNVIDIDASNNDTYVDFITFNIAGSNYIELDYYKSTNQNFNSDIVINSEVHVIDEESGDIGETVDLLSDDEVITSAYNVNDGTCLSVMKFYEYDFWGDDCELRFYDSSLEPTNILYLEDIVGEEVNYVNCVASVSEDAYAINYYDGDFEIDTVIVSKEGELLDNSYSYINSGSLYFNFNGYLFAYDDSGLYVIIDGEPVCIVDGRYMVDAGFDILDSFPIVLSNTDISFMTVDYEESLEKTLKKVSSCDNPYEDRTEITIGCPRSVPSYLPEQIDIFNETNDDYYAVPLIISCDGVDPIISNIDVDNRINEIINNVPVTNEDEYSIKLAEECAFSMEFEEFISGPNAPDVVATEGFWAQLAEPGLMEDLSNIYADLSDDDYYTNIINASSSVGNRFMPVAYFVSGVIDYSDNSGNASLTDSMSYSNYANMVNDEWNGEDPIAMSCTPEEYAEELISSQYNLYIDRTTGNISFSENEEFDRLMNFMVYSVWSTNACDVESDYYADYYYGRFFSIYDFTYMDEDGSTLYALPSGDGRTVAAEPILCLGITSSSDSKDGAKEFLLNSISYESQIVCGSYNYGIPVNKEALEYLMIDEEEHTKDTLDDFISGISNVYVADVELRYACYGPLYLLANGGYDSDYEPELAGRDIENNMEYFMQED